MSFREKLAWTSLIATAAIYGWYFATELPLQAKGTADHSLLGVTILLLALAQAIPTVVLAIQSPREAKMPLDEREKLIVLKGNRAGYVVLTSGALVCCVAGTHFGVDGTMLGNLILLAIVVAQIAKDIFQIAHHRFGV
jgi:hypothetical protein